MTDHNIKGPKKQTYSPSRYMRDRHPDLFSDTVKAVEYNIEREVLSYHLETLTNQKFETQFENFAQRLCEKFIAPNIRPQTGPVGGGDGKTDAETFPVSAEISARWFLSDGDKTGERIAFAFSAKKAWRAKIKSDVAGIANTKRNYNHIICVTNQFVPAKKSADLQDEFMKEHGIAVTILDRTWLLDRVLKHDSVIIAVEELGIGKGIETQVTKIGPNDLTRSDELHALENKIVDGSQYQNQPFALVEDARRAAFLSRSLEYQAEAVNGRYERAFRLAKKYNIQKLELIIAYEWAWTSYFWHEDYERASELYDIVEKLAINSENANDLERLCNLLAPLRVSAHQGMLVVPEGKIKERTDALLEALDRQAKRAGQPNNALHAEALFLLTLVSAKGVEHRNDPLRDIWLKFNKIIENASGLGSFPFISIAETLTQVGEFIADSGEFDNLFELITDTLAIRAGEGEAGKKNLQRAYQKLTRDLPSDAIRWFGRAIPLLTKEEFESELIDTLIGASFAFEKLGLPWAARNYALAAASHDFTSMKKHGSVSVIRASILSRYFDAEFRLGRIPQILMAHELEVSVRVAQARTEGQQRHLDKTFQGHMMKIAALLLQAPFDTVKSVAQLPDVFERLGLPMSRTALLYLMGNEDILRAEGSIPETETRETAEMFMLDLRQYASNARYPEPDFALGDILRLVSNVLGCRIEISCAKNTTSIAIGEAIPGSLEAFLATSLDHCMIPQVDHLKLHIAPHEAAGLAPTLEFTDVDGEPIGLVRHRSRMIYMSKEDAVSFPNWLRDATLEIFLNFASPHDVENWARIIFEDERALDRALSFSNIPVLVGNLHGEQDYYDLSHWIDPADAIYEMGRTHEWPPLSSPDTIKTVGTTERGEGLPPKKMLDRMKMDHSTTRWISPINVQKWDKAKWVGALFMWAEAGIDGPPPVLSLLFENLRAARDIFANLRRRYGTDDANNDLGITIVRGISQKHPAAYAVVIGHNPERILFEEDSILGFVSRINRMYPQTTANLDGFLANYAIHGSYSLMPARMSHRHSEPEPVFSLSIRKNNLNVVNAWEIAPNDMIAVALELDDLPLIPSDKPDAPVLRTLEWLRALRELT